MDAIRTLPHATKAILAGSALYLLLSYFSWQRHSFGPAGTYAQSLWHGFGILVALAAVAFTGWEVMRVLYGTVELGDVDPDVASVGFAAVLLFLNLILFLDWSEYRAWPAWLGLLVVLGITGAACYRARSADGELVKQLTGLLERARDTLAGRTVVVPVAAADASDVRQDRQPAEA